MTPAHSRDCPMAEQSVGWVLHALEPEEELEVARHLETCEVCRTVVRETEESLSVLGGSVEPLEPPPALRARILAAAARTPQEQPAPVEPPALEQAAPEPVVLDEPVVVEPAASAEPTVSVPEPAPASRRRGGAGSGPGRADRGARPGGLRARIGLLAVAAVAVAAIAGLGVYSAQLKSERDAETARAQSVVAMVEQMSRPGSEHAFLAAGGQTVAAVVSATDQRMVLPVDLPANGDAHVYVLWGMHDGAAPAPLGTFDVAGDAAPAVSVGSTAGGAGFAQYAISLEPGRVAPASPTDVVASGRAEI